MIWIFILKFLLVILPLALSLLIIGAILVGLIYGMPVTKKEKTKAFVDVLAMGIADGHSPEHIVVGLSKAREQSLGVRFHLLAAHIENGSRLGQALEKTPKFLPRKIRAMLHIGEETGLLRPMLEASRKTLSDATSQTLTAMNYLTPSLIFAFVLPLIFSILSITVFPKFRAIMQSMTIPLPSFAQWVFHSSGLLFALFCIPAIAVYLRWLFFESARGNALEDRVLFSLRWRYTRMQRDFAATLALLLDAGLPEEKALSLAAEGTGNQVFATRVQTAIAKLRDGLKLTQAVQRLDATGEFQWRLQNAARGENGFSRALSGWVESLDAKAFRQEQTVSTAFTTGLILLNAVGVGLVAIAIFQTLIAIVNAGVLW
jgi:type II secretory pathway component PulF